MANIKIFKLLQNICIYICKIRGYTPLSWYNLFMPKIKIGGKTKRIPYAKGGMVKKYGGGGKIKKYGTGGKIKRGR